MTPTSPYQVFLVEDNALIAEQERYLLLRWGYIVTGWATSAAAALHSLRQHRPDIVLINVQLAGRSDGIDLARMIQALWMIPVIIISGFLWHNLSERIHLLKGVSFLQKPFLPFQIKEIVQFVLSNRDTPGQTSM